jgi:hypothetical protein
MENQNAGMSRQVHRRAGGLADVYGVDTNVEGQNSSPLYDEDFVAFLSSLQAEDAMQETNPSAESARVRSTSLPCWPHQLVGPAQDNSFEMQR